MDEQTKNTIKLGGFPPIIYYGEEKKKIKEFSKKKINDTKFDNIDKFNFLNIKNILNK